MRQDDALVTDTGDEAQVQRAGQKVKDKARQDKADIRHVLGTEPGRRFVWRLLEQCRVFESVFSREAATMGFMAGQQDVGHALMQWIEQADDAALGRLMQEAHNKRRRARAENRASRIDSAQETE